MDLVSEELAEQASRWESLTRKERVDLARRIRACGLSLTEVAGIVPMSKPTLSVWCRDVELTLGQQAAIKRRTAPRRGIKRDTQRKRRAQVEALRIQARNEASLLMRAPVFAAGVALYWAEGSKSVRSLQMANSDPRLLRLFISWVKDYLDPKAEFTMALNLHADNDIARAHEYWAAQLPIEEPRFTKPFIKPDGTGHRKNHLPFGVCRVTTRRSADMWIRSMEWIECLAELADGRVLLPSCAGR